MNKIRLFLTLLFIGSSVIANAQDWENDGVIGGICSVGQHCPPVASGPGGGHVDPSPYDPGYPDDYQDYRDYDRREIYVGRRVGNEHLDLLRMAGISSWSDRGLIIDSVEIRGQTGAVQASVDLNADGYVVASQRWPSNFISLRPNRTLVVGQNLNQLTLGVFGHIYIDRITIYVRHGGYNPPPPQPPAYGDVIAQSWVGQSFYSLTTLDLVRLTNLNQYRGYRVVSVTVRGRNLDSRGSARVVINGQTAGRVDLQYGGETIRMPINPTVGYNLSGLNLIVAPASRIDSVQVELSRY